MATNYYNAQIGVVDASGNVNVIYPITKASNVDVTSKVYGSGSATTVLQTALDNIVTALGSKAPTSHASAETTYGAGTETNYGHVKLSDEYLNASNYNKAAYSIGASSYAVRKVYSEFNSKHQYHKNYSFDSVTIGAKTATEITISGSFVTQWTGAYCSFYNGSTEQPYIIFIHETYASPSTTKIFVFNAFSASVTINKVTLNYTTA